MSWRDRLVLRDSEAHPDADSTATEANGTIGAIGSGTFSTTAGHWGMKEKHRSDQDSSPQLVPNALAVSAESVDRAETSFAIANGADADSSANSAQSFDPPARSGDAISAISANRSSLSGATWGENHEGRAAIVEHDGGIPRAWVEGFARLHPDRPPGDVQPRRWQTFVDDCGRFLDGGWAERATPLGWGPHDLFGCDRDRPFARIDQAGLLWLLNGDKLVDLSENAATIETRTGARQTWRRKPVEPCRVLAWEIVP